MKYKGQFCIFILTHGRADNVITYKTLEDITDYPIYFVCDDGDEQLKQYKKNFGKDRVCIFSKEAQFEDIDRMDNFGKLKMIGFARNACFDIAEKLGYRYFVEFDDDYTGFGFTFDKNAVYYHHNIHEKKILDGVFDSYLDLLNSSPKMLTLSMAQGGDFVGAGFASSIRVKRKAMNSFFCDTRKKFLFTNCLNEDVNMYVRENNRGNVVLQTNICRLTQLATQQNKGGMTDIYVDCGTYVKSFYSVIVNPSAVHIQSMGVTNMRLHHHVNYNKCCPKIIRAEVKKQ